MLCCDTARSRHSRRLPCLRSHVLRAFATLNQNRQTRLLYLGDVQITRGLRAFSHVYLFFKNKNKFYSAVWPTVFTYLVKTFTENASFSKTLSRKEIFENRGLSFTCGRTKTDVFDTMMSYIIHSVPCKVFNLSSIVLAFSCRLAKTIWRSYVCTRIFSTTGKKISVCQNIRILVCEVAMKTH